MSDSSGSASRTTPTGGGSVKSSQKGDKGEVGQSPSDLNAEFEILQTRLIGNVGTKEERLQLLQQMRENFRIVMEQNQQLAESLREARHQIAMLTADAPKSMTSPMNSGTFLQAHDDGTIEVFARGRKMRVSVSPAVDINQLQPGHHVLLDQALTVVFSQTHQTVGEVMNLREILDDGDRALVTDHARRDRIVKLSKSSTKATLRAGDSVLVEPNSGYIIERVTDAVERWFVDEIPDIDYDKIGGLAEQIRQIRDAIELPYLHSDLFERFRLRPPNGILFYGPPGCGKTMIAKAMANSLARQVTDRTGKEGRCHFLSIKGPEMLDKYVGETERRLRLVFQRARERSAEGMPVIVFFDEMDAIFRLRRSGGEWSLEDTLIPQLVWEIDAIESLRNVLVVGTSSREDAIDPAILRPGRIDTMIKVNRPNSRAAREILAKHLTPDVPIHSDELASHAGDVKAAIEDIIRRTVDNMYAENEMNALFEATYVSGNKEVIYLGEFCSGVTIRNVLNRAKSSAVTRFLRSRNLGLKVQDLYHATTDEIRDIKDFSNNDWARFVSEKGERVIYIRTLGPEGTQFAGRSIEVGSGEFL